MSRARDQEWLRVHLETLPERQLARENARREKAPRRQNLRWSLRPWEAGQALRPEDAERRV